MKKLLFLLTLTLLFSAHISAAEAGKNNLGLFPFFTMGENIADIWLNPTSQKEAGVDGQVLVDGDRFITEKNGKEIRFWGVNTCFSMNFPEKEDAVKYAKRMASFGINAVRLHHMDSHDIWGKNLPDVTKIDAEQLDKLDWLIYQFKLNGIYVNINLHVSRTLDDRVGFRPKSESPNYNKGLDNFHPKMIEAQKQYARDLLTHVNPYTKMAYTDDPCVAMIEINNENSVVASWFWGNLDTLGAEYEAEFQKQWNVWLKKKYSSTEELRKAWGCKIYPYQESIVPADSFKDADALQNSAWKCENGSGSQAKLESKDGILRMVVTKCGEVSWNPQFYFSNFPIQGGVPHKVKFRVRALEQESHQLSTGCSQNHAEWQNLGFSRRFDVGKEWKEYEYTFLANQDDPKARLAFSGFKPGVYEFADVSLVPGGEIGIGKEEKLEDGSVRIVYQRKDGYSATQEMKSDFVNFLIDTETKYWCEMKDFIKNDLHAKAPVCGTQLNYGAHYAQGKMDYCDNHAYWNHPSFPGRPWDGGNWKLGNTSISNTLGNNYATVTNLANNRVLGRPYTVSEYNHPYPNLYGAECMPVISSVAGFQHWNGIFIFAWSHNKAFSPEETPSFFDIKGNSVQLVHMIASHNLFVRGDVKHADNVKNAEKVVYEVGDQQERDILASASGGYSRSLASVGFCHENPMLTSVGVRLSDLNISDPDTDGVKPFVKPEDHQSPKKTVSNTEQLRWNGEIENRGFYQVDTPRTKIFTGFIQGRTFEYKDGMKIEFGETLLDWATISYTQTKKNRWLLAATGLQKNTDCVLGLYAEKVVDTPVEEYPNLINKQITFCQNRGRAPLMCEGIPAKITIPAPEGVTVKYYPLDGNAKPMCELTAKRIDSDHVQLEISREYKTLWYEVVFEK
ncbi:MAG: carbohydrate binding domain-containing protein [Planctomycetia bacterium]|nr:carbohydrate binding domain-containing protein [Planctomycetia bacterium]